MKDTKIIIEVEQRLLAILLNYPESVSFAIEKLKPSDFTLSNNQVIFKEIIQLNEKKEVINYINLIDSLERNQHLLQAGGINFVSNVLSMYYGHDDFESLVEKVYNEAKRKELNNIISEFNSEKEITDDIERLMFDFQATMNNFSFDFRKNSVVSVGDVLNDIEWEMEYLRRNPNARKGIATGYNQLDEVTGLFETQQLIFICARPSQGKTAFATQLAMKMAQQFKKKTEEQNQPKQSICLFSLEMKKESVVRRMVANNCSLETWKLKNGYEFNKDEFERWRQGRKKFKELSDYIFIEDQSGIGLNGIRNKLLKMKREHNTKVVIIDYLQIIGRSGFEKADDFQFISRLSEGLKHIARELDMVIICLSQLNRGVEGRTDKRPMLSDIKGSGSAEAAADIVMMLYRDDYYQRVEQRENVSIMEVIVAKNREHKTGVIQFYFDKEKMRFSEIENK